MGASKTFADFVATLNETTTNVATVSGSVTGPGGTTSCGATATVTVSVPTTPACSLTTATPTPFTSSKQLRWSITNNGAATATLKRVTAIWPATQRLPEQGEAGR